MKCTLIHKALSAIDEAEGEGYINLDHKLAAQFNEMGLVSAYTTWFYGEMQSNAKKLKRAKLRLDKTPRTSDLEQLRARIRKLEAMPDPEGYKPTLDGNYVKLTEKGEVLNAHLSGRLPELEDILLEDVESELEEFQSRMDAQYSRFIGMYNLMNYTKKEGSEQDFNDVIDCAVRLSTMEGPIPDIYERMRVINDYFIKNSRGFKGYQRLIPTAAITMQSGLIERLMEDVTKIYNAILYNYSGNFQTWWLAAELMNLNRSDLKENIKRYFEVRNALAKTGWKKFGRHTSYMAVHLARRRSFAESSAEELAREHNSLKNRLVNSGRRYHQDTGTAALILMDGDGTLDERVDRFVEAYETMHSQGWDTHVNFYPVAAAITLLPGSVKENVLWLDRIVARLKKGGFADKNQNWEGHKDGLTYRALPMLMAAYKDQFRQEVTPTFIMHSGDSLIKK